MLRSLLPRTRSAFESRTQVWRDVGLGSEIDPAAARRGKGGAILSLALIAGVLVAFSERKTLFPGYGLEARIATVGLLVLLGWRFLAAELAGGVLMIAILVVAFRWTLRRRMVDAARVQADKGLQGRMEGNGEMDRLKRLMRAKSACV